MRTLFPNLSHDTRRILFVCCFAFFMNGTMTMMMGSLLPDVKLAYRLSDSQSGLMLAGHSAGNLLACFLSGLVPLWLGRRRAIVTLSAATSVGFLMTLLCGNPVWLIIAFALTGVARGSISNFNNATANRITGGNPSASILLHSFFAMGAIGAPLLFLLTRSLGGWQAAVALIILLGMTVTLNYSRIHLEDDRPDPTDQTQKSMVFLHNRSFWISGGMMFFYLCAEYAINGWLVTYLQNKPELLSQFAEDGGMGVMAYSQTMATLLWLIILIGRLFSAALARKLPQKLLMMVSSVGVALFFTLLLLSTSLPLVTVSVAGLGFCMAGICPMIYSDASYITNLYPMGTSMLLAIGSVGAILMPALVGFMADAYGFVWGMRSILLGVAALLALSVWNYIRKPTPIMSPAALGTAQ